MPHIFKSVNKEPFTSPLVEFEEGYTKYKDKSLCHEAGYDAYVAGFVYIRLSHYLGIFKCFNKNNLQGSLQNEPVSPVFPTNDLVSKYTNHLPLNKTDASVNLTEPNGSKMQGFFCGDK